MKTLLRTLCLMAACLSFICHSSSLFSDEVKDAHSLHHSSEWTGADDELYFDIELDEGLGFNDTYYTFAIKKGVGCEISYKPLLSGTVFSKEGNELQEVTVTVELTNTSKLDEIDYKVLTNSVYLVKNKNGKADKTVSSLSTVKGTLIFSTLDIKEPPVFFLTNEEETKGSIAFKSLFPFMSM